MHAGMAGTDQSFALTSKLDEESEREYDHAESYQEQDEEGEWLEGDPEIWLEGVANSIKELEQYASQLLCGNETLEALITDLTTKGYY